MTPAVKKAIETIAERSGVPYKTAKQYWKKIPTEQRKVFIKSVIIKEQLDELHKRTRSEAKRSIVSEGMETEHLQGIEENQFQGEG